VRDAESYDEKGLQTVRWHKICTSAAFNPSSILASGIYNADTALDPDLCAHLKVCMGDVFAVSNVVLGRPLPDKLAKPG
jgi:2-dehydropantoate 2-reductase